MKIVIALRPDPEHPLRHAPTDVIVDGVPLASYCKSYRLEHVAGDIPVLDFTLNVLGIELACETSGRLGSIAIAGLGEVASITLADGRVLDSPLAMFGALNEYHARQAEAAHARRDEPLLQAGSLTDAEADAGMAAGMRELERQGDPAVASPGPGLTTLEVPNCPMCDVAFLVDVRVGEPPRVRCPSCARSGSVHASSGAGVPLHAVIEWDPPGEARPH